MSTAPAEVIVIDRPWPYHCPTKPEGTVTAAGPGGGVVVDGGGAVTVTVEVTGAGVVVPGSLPVENPPPDPAVESRPCCPDPPTADEEHPHNSATQLPRTATVLITSQLSRIDPAGAARGAKRQRLASSASSTVSMWTPRSSHGVGAPAATDATTERCSWRACRFCRASVTREPAACPNRLALAPARWVALRVTAVRTSTSRPIRSWTAARRT